MKQIKVMHHLHSILNIGMPDLLVECTIISESHIYEKLELAKFFEHPDIRLFILVHI